MVKEERVKLAVSGSALTIMSLFGMWLIGSVAAILLFPFGVLAILKLACPEKVDGLAQKVKDWKNNFSSKHMKALGIVGRVKKLLTEPSVRFESDVFCIEGFHNHPSILVLPFIWLVVVFILPMSNLMFIASLTVGVIVVVSVQILLCRYTIRVGLGRTKFQTRYWFIPLRTIHSRTTDVVIEHRDADGLGIVITPATYDMKQHSENLRFSYLTPWDGDHREMYVDYLGEEMEFYPYDPAPVWSKLLDGLRMLQSKAVEAQSIPSSIEVRNRSTVGLPLSGMAAFMFFIPCAILTAIPIMGFLSGQPISNVPMLMASGISFVFAAILLWSMADPWVKFRHVRKATASERWFQLPIPEIALLVGVIFASFLLTLGYVLLGDGDYAGGLGWTIGALTAICLLVTVHDHPRIWLSDSYSLSDPSSDSSDKGKGEITAAELQEDGNFNYHDSGFSVVVDNETIAAEWIEVERIYAYKIDNFAYDTIIIQVELKDGKNFRFTDDCPGWWHFMEIAESNLDGFKKEWFFKVAFPAFRTNLTEVYSAAKESIE